MTSTLSIRACHSGDHDAMLAIINSAAEAYRGAIPADCWHEPYMSRAQLERDIAAGVAFWGLEMDGRLAGIMGIQGVDDVDLIRHAYVSPDVQRGGVGAALIAHLRSVSARPILVGTWAAATWAIRFYERNGFALVPAAETPVLLRRYWSVPERQAEVSVVLAERAR
ncbi:MAG: GCN5-related N-acetyltransferase [Gemmatimonadetes bacterium]|nr:GCN5-related N-acetyltransferase [Gemmatimonadota bacterium]